MRSTKASSGLLFLFSVVIFIGFSDSVTAKTHVETIDGLISPSLDLPKGSEVQQILFGTGVQIYTFNGTAWASTNVSADLYNFKGIKVGHHFFLSEKDENGGQVSWEIFHPFSRVSGKVVSTVASPQPDSIAWLLVEATTHIGKKKFLGSTAFIQRLFTHDGLMPSADFPAKKGDVFNSNYSALYKFSKWA